MFEYEELTDIIGCSCTLLIPYFNAVESAEVAHSDSDIRIGKGVGSAQFETGSIRAINAAD